MKFPKRSKKVRALSTVANDSLERVQGGRQIGRDQYGVPWFTFGSEWSGDIWDGAGTIIEAPMLA